MMETYMDDAVMPGDEIRPQRINQWLLIVVIGLIISAAGGWVAGKTFWQRNKLPRSIEANNKIPINRRETTDTIKLGPTAAVKEKAQFKLLELGPEDKIGIVSYKAIIQSLIPRPIITRCTPQYDMISGDGSWGYENDLLTTRVGLNDPEFLAEAEKYKPSGNKYEYVQACKNDNQDIIYIYHVPSGRGGGGETVQVIRVTASGKGQAQVNLTEPLAFFNCAKPLAYGAANKLYLACFAGDGEQGYSGIYEFDFINLTSRVVYSCSAESGKEICGYRK